MGRNCVWLGTEYRRAAAMLPRMLRRAIILAAICVMAANMVVFCSKKEGTDDSRLRIGYVAGEDMLTGMALSYVQDMESVKSLCSLEPVGQDEGLRLLGQGELSALIVLPDDVVGEILSGSNAPAALYMPQGSGTGAVGDMLFRELANAGIGMLGTAQAEIYASSAVLDCLAGEYAAGEGMDYGGMLRTLYDGINRFNLGIVAEREDLFDIRRVSATGNDTYAVYYASAIFTVYMLLSGLFFGEFCRRGRLEQAMAAKRLGVSYLAQLTGKCLACILLMAAVASVPFLAVLLPPANGFLTVGMSVAGALALSLIVLDMAAYFMLVYQLAGKRQPPLVVIGLSALIQAYLSGCLVPSVLLPQSISAVGRLLPAAYVKAGFTIVFTGEGRTLPRVAAGLLLWGVLFMVSAWAALHVEEWHKSPAGPRLPHRRAHMPSIPAILLRRLLHKKSIWACMALVAVLSVAITTAERQSQTLVKAAVYDEDGVFAPALEAYEGLVAFECLGSREEVRQAVLSGDAECGYILPGGLGKAMAQRKAKRSVAVYQDEDAVAVPVVNEVLFERIFRQVSLQWFEEYLAGEAGGSVIAQEGIKAAAGRAFARQLAEGTTFTFALEYVGGRGEAAWEEGQKSTYPLRPVAGAAVLLCGLQGVLQAVSDGREKRFYKRNRAAMSALTAALPALLGLFAGALTIAAVWIAS